MRNLTFCLLFQTLKDALTGSDTSAADIFNAVSAQVALGAKPDGAAVSKALQAALKKDDSLANLGLAFRAAAAAASSASDATAVFERVEDAIVQADEVDGRMLQFEGGLSVTSSIVTGAYALASKAGKSEPGFKREQAVKFANYFLSRKSVQTAKGGLALLEALSALADNKFYVPVAVTLVSAPAAAVVSLESPKVS